MLKKCLYEKPYIRWTFFRKRDNKNSPVFRLSSFLCSTVTIEIACIRKMMKLINRKTSDYYRTVSLDALTPASEPSYEIKEEVSQDYTLYEKSFQALI